MMLTNWWKFNFFDFSPDVDGGRLSTAIQESASLTCFTSGRGFLLLGDSSGSAHFVSRRFDLISHRLYDISISHLLQIKFSPTLAAVGEDELGVSSVKIFGLEQLDGGGAPRFLRQIRLPTAGGSTGAAAIGGTSVSCLALHEQLAYMAVGFTDGRVALWRGDVTRERAGKHQLLPVGDPTTPAAGRCVTGLGFRSSGKVHHLFVATTHSVFCYNITIKGKEQQVMLDKTGCALDCAVMSEGVQEVQFLVGRTDAVYCFSPNERGACFAFDGCKHLLHWYKSYLITVASSEPAVATTEAGANRTLNVYDVTNHYVAFSARLGDVTHVAAEWGALFAITADRRLHRLTEKDLHSKLQVLFRKNLYDMGIRLAKSQDYCADDLMNIFREYGDHLYEKGNYSEAVQQYIKTIGKLAPSYVIRKYLDTQRVGDLTGYLQALHRSDQASQDHTTLLLNCYTKLRDTEHLDQFIQSDDVRYDVDTAVRVCRGSGYPRQAVSLASRHQQHDVVLSILLEDLLDADAALLYIRNLPPEQCEQAIVHHGVRLLDRKSSETVALLKDICCQQGGGTSVELREFVDLFISKPKAQKEFLQHILQNRPEALDSDLLLTLLELYLSADSDGDSSAATTTVANDETTSRQMALMLLDNANLDTPMALHLCQLHKFEEGVNRLYQASGMHTQTLRSQLSAGDFESALSTCRQHGTEDPTLWMLALRGMVAQLQPPDDQIKVVLEHIERDRLAPLMEVMELLVAAPNLQLGCVREFLCHALSAEQQRTTEDRGRAAKLAQEADDIRRQISRDETSAVIFQRTSCSACRQPLELPIVHFFCPHSFHRHCLRSFSERDDQCPLCLPANEQLLAQIRHQTSESETEAALYARLTAGDDVFDVVADFIGRGVIPNPTWHQPTSLPSAGDTEQLGDSQLQLDMGSYFQFGSSVDGAPSSTTEARLRIADRAGHHVLETTSEGRVRLGELRSSTLPVTSEGRLRSDQVTQVRAGQSEARVRVSENVARQQRHPREAMPTRAASNRQQMAGQASTNPFEEAAPEAPKNPFEEDYDDSKNPFAVAGSDYDESLNPFAE